MTEKPNLLLIYTDQQRYDTIRALGAPWMITPNLDQLCEESLVFKNATCPSPVCMPDRWSLHTGQWPGRHQCYSNHHLGPRPAYSLPSLLRERGYVSGLIGKNHSYLRPEDLEAFDVEPERSAAVFLAARQRALAGDQFDGRLCSVPIPGGRKADPESYKTDAALRFIDANRRRPFFLWLSYLNPHTPYVATEPYYSLYDEDTIPEPILEPGGLEAARKPFRQCYHRDNTNRFQPYDRAKTRRMRHAYYAMVSLIDEEIGRIVEYLDRSGLREKTLILFTSDHGDYMGDHGLYTKSPAMYDCLTRVPFIASWPGTLPPGESSSDFVSHVDILPAFVSLAGGRIPGEVQGRDFLACHARGEATRPAAYAEYGIPGRPYDNWSLKEAGYSGRGFANPGDATLPWEGNPVSLSGRIRMIRTEDWKLVEEPGGTNELYDLRSDQNELSNVYGRPDTIPIGEQLSAIGDSISR